MYDLIVRSRSQNQAYQQPIIGVAIIGVAIIGVAILGVAKSVEANSRTVPHKWQSLLVSFPCMCI